MTVVCVRCESRKHQSWAEGWVRVYLKVWSGEGRAVELTDHLCPDCALLALNHPVEMLRRCNLEHHFPEPSWQRDCKQ